MNRTSAAYRTLVTVGAVQPAQINYTLNAMATALEGRGEAIGESLSILDDYLKRANPQIPVLIENLRKLGAVSEVHRDVVPELASILRNSVTTGRTFLAKPADLRGVSGPTGTAAQRSKVPDVATLRFGPLARGTEVSLR